MALVRAFAMRAQRVILSPAKELPIALRAHVNVRLKALRHPDAAELVD